MPVNFDKDDYVGRGDPVDEIDAICRFDFERKNFGLMIFVEIFGAATSARKLTVQINTASIV